ALAVGPYDELIADAIEPNEIRDREVPFRSYAAAGKGEKLREATDSTYDLLSIQEEYFDYPYPYAKLDLIAAPDFAYGAMENAGAIIYREAALLIDERTSLARRRAILTTHAHELAHQWFGNLVTPKWWDDIWLNEAFATWMSYKTMHAYDPEGGFDRQPTVRGIGAMVADSLASARQIRNPINENGDILSAFDGITYSKGGHVLSMFENYLGEDAFREGMRLHMRRFEDGVADVNDFMASLAEGSGNPGVVESFKSFIFQPGIPFLDVAVSCPADGAPGVAVTQARYAPLGSTIDPAATWQVPFAMRASINGEVQTITALLTDETTNVPVAGGCPDWVMPNAGGKGYWRFNTSDENWAALTEEFEGLTAGEQMIFADSLVAAFRAGKVPADKLLAGLRATPTGSWDAARIPVGPITRFAGLVDGEAESAMRTWIGETYAPLYEDLTGRDDLDQGETLLLETVKRTLINEAENKDLRAEILRQAEAYVGLGREAPDPSALAPAFVTTGIVVGVQDGGDAFFDAALAVAKASQNQRERRSIFNVLASTGPKDKVTALLTDALGETFQGQEALFMYYAALANEKSVRDAAWVLFKTNFDALLTRIPEIRKPQTATAVSA
ncbi:MAG: M1 family metallopeptidase, partial [Pseudomonadota bacterium]